MPLSLQSAIIITNFFLLTNFVVNRYSPYKENLDCKKKLINIYYTKAIFKLKNKQPNNNRENYDDY